MATTPLVPSDANIAATSDRAKPAVIPAWAQDIYTEALQKEIAFLNKVIDELQNKDLADVDFNRLTRALALVTKSIDEASRNLMHIQGEADQTVRVEYRSDIQELAPYLTAQELGTLMEIMDGARSRRARDAGGGVALVDANPS